MSKTDLSGANWEVVHANCDALTKDESVRVYASAVVEKGSDEIIFDYDPNGNQTPPTIETLGDRKVLISVGDIGTVFVQKNRWRDIAIVYRVGRVRYPSDSTVVR